MTRAVSPSPSVNRLLERGVVLPCPEAVEVDEMLDPGRIAPGVVIHAGSKLLGKTTSVGPGCELGAEAPVTLKDCQLGAKVELKGGYFAGATFLDGASMGSGAHVRPGTLLEEQASGAHAVAFKQTILLSYVTAGSLINFCDALMAGGTSRKNHSEIGSSYIHFNYTPHQDKATPSLLGDVPSGVMLNRDAIFLGGQGGLVGPVRIAYGTILPAGTICRQDVLEENLLFSPAATEPTRSRSFRAGAYRSIQRIVRNNLIYIGNLRALEAWYRKARKRRMCVDRFGEAVYEGALSQIACVVDERLQRLGEFAERMPRSLELARQYPDLALTPALEAQQERLRQTWPEMASALRQGPAEDTEARSRDAFLEAFERNCEPAHLKAVAALEPEPRALGERWLQAIVDATAGLWT